MASSRELPPKGLLTRSTTFDDRRIKKAEADVAGFKPLKKAQTFYRETDLASNNVAMSPSVSYSEALYRRYFGFEDNPDEAHSQLQPFIQRRLRSCSAVSDTGSSHRKDRCVVVVDTFSTGAMLSYLVHKEGFRVIRVLSGDLEALLEMVPEGLEGLEYVTTISYNLGLEPELALQETIAAIKAVGFPVEAVFAGAETGVELADRLSERMALRTNGTALSEARRNKYVMGETVRRAGVRAVKQLRSAEWREIEDWLKAWGPDPYLVIVKPLDSAGSDDVSLCKNLNEVKISFGNIMGKVNGLGLVNRAVLVQEYLEGQEYVIDMVSRDGVHKVVAIWAYDRRAANGAQFVCFGQRLLTMDEPHTAELVWYQSQVLTALGILNGPSHGEVKWCRGEPVLIEVGARCHGGDGLWVSIANEVLGYNQVQASIDAYLHPDKFASLPSLPVKRRAYGAMKWLVNTQPAGALKAVDASLSASLAALPSHRGHQYFRSAGDAVIPTQNCFSWMGCFSLAHPDKDQLEQDYAKLLQAEANGLFQIEASPPVASTTRPCVAVVDPFSTGAVMAHMLAQREVDVVAVYSAGLDQLANLQSMVPPGLTLNFASVVGFDEDVDAMVRSIGSVVAVMAGTETGVELADRLSERMGLRTNGTALSEARRNKYVMGETVRRAGVRAVKQLRSAEWKEIEDWLKAWGPDPYLVIVKPLDSAGSDDVTLCKSLREVQLAFNHIMGKVNGLGLVNRAVLVQEYLEGQEYVIDMVSRDGVHKVVAIWAYDRRAANGAQFVCFGQRLLTMDEPYTAELISYQSQVLTALGILNGPSHGEVKWCRGEPVLIEVGARCHGGEGAWVGPADGVYGYNQLGATLDVYLSPQSFDTLPAVPLRRLGHGFLAFLVLYKSGEFVGVNPALLEELLALQSVQGVMFFPKPGESVKATFNCFTWAGVVMIFHKDEEVANKAYARIREMEEQGLFIVKE